MAPGHMRRKRVVVLAVVLLAAVAAGAYGLATRTPQNVARAAIGAVRADNPGQRDDEWRATCDEAGGDTYRCVVTWKQVGVAPADEVGDFCEDFSVEVRGGRETTTRVRLENEQGISLRRC